MPYIKLEDRKLLDSKIDMITSYLTSKGAVNYAISRIVHLWVMQSAIANKLKLGYSTLSEGHAVLQDAAAEYYHAVMVPYEQKKSLENGSVSKLDQNK